MLWSFRSLSKFFHINLNYLKRENKLTTMGWFIIVHRLTLLQLLVTQEKNILLNFKYSKIINYTKYIMVTQAMVLSVGAVCIWRLKYTFWKVYQVNKHKHT